MPATLSGVRCTSLPILRPLLKEWIATNIDLAAFWQFDVPWWYNERASTSVLAGAAWRIRGFAFEEYGEDKKTGKKGRPTFPGRVDLYLKVKGQQFIAEAKYCWSGATRVIPATAQNLTNRLQEACDDIRIVPRHGQRKLGILFATPYIAKSREARVDELLSAWIAAITSVKCSCSAWVFPAESRDISGLAICPGAAVLIKEVRPPRRLH